MAHSTQSTIFSHLDHTEVLIYCGRIAEASSELGKAQSIFSEWFHEYNDEDYEGVNFEITQKENKIDKIMAFIKAL